MSAFDDERQATSAGREDTVALVVEAGQQRADYLHSVLRFLGYRVNTVTADNWRDALSDKPGDAVLISPDVPEPVVTAMVAAARKRTTPLIRLLPPDAPRATFAGAGHVLITTPYPPRHPDFSEALQRSRARQPVEQQGDPETERMLERMLVGVSRDTRRIRSLIRRVAPSDATVLIQGETGTGKEVVARAIWASSKRRDKPFVAINCGAIPGELLESELFGHEKGAFTGALSARQGRFELAEGGTLFLDEIGDMPMPMQVKLLRVLQERRFERVGSNRTLRADVRVIAATHRELEAAIERGEFRADLFYRLHVFPIEVTPLRERVDDIPPLVHTLTRRLRDDGGEDVRFSAAAMNVLTRNRWPGNVRELANLVERLSIMFPDEVVDVDDLPARVLVEAGVEPLADDEIETYEPVADGLTAARLPREGIDLREHLGQLEEALIREALDEADGVVAQAAKLLRLQRTTLVEKIRKYGIHRDADPAEF